MTTAIIIAIVTIIVASSVVYALLQRSDKIKAQEQLATLREVVKAANLEIARQDATVTRLENEAAEAAAQYEHELAVQKTLVIGYAARETRLRSEVMTLAQTNAQAAVDLLNKIYPRGAVLAPVPEPKLVRTDYGAYELDPSDPIEVLK